MGKYNVGEVWWIHFPYGDKDVEKRRPSVSNCYRIFRYLMGNQSS